MLGVKLFYSMLSAVILSAVLLSITLLDAIIPSDILLIVALTCFVIKIFTLITVNMPSVVTLAFILLREIMVVVVRLSVVAPFLWLNLVAKKRRESDSRGATTLGITTLRTMTLIIAIHKTRHSALWPP